MRIANKHILSSNNLSDDTMLDMSVQGLLVDDQFKSYLENVFLKYQCTNQNMQNTETGPSNLWFCPCNTG